MAQIVHTRGEFHSYRTTSPIHLGAYELTVPANSIVEFDGMVLKWGEDKYNLPLFTGACNAGWAVPVEDNVTKYVPKPAGVVVRPATSAGQERGEAMEIGKAPDEEDVFVGTIEDANARRKMSNTPKPSQESMDRAAALAAARKKQAEVSALSVEDSENSVGMEILSDDQGAVAVATLGDRDTAVVGSNAVGGKRTLLSDPTQASTAVRMAEAVRPIKTAKKVVSAPKSESSEVVWDRGNRKPTERANDAVAKYGSDPAALKQVLNQETAQVQRMIKKELKSLKS